MPSLSLYRDYITSNNSGDAKKVQSDDIMEHTWLDDVSAQVAYLYDYYHDDEPLKMRGLHPQGSNTKIPIDIKFIRKLSQTFNKDQVYFHILLRPSQECNVDYYDEFFANRYDALFPIGLYIDIMDSDGSYNKWLVIAKGNYYDIQYPTYEVLPCTYVYQMILDRKKFEIAGVPRSQNSYNSGLWTDYKIESPENQQKFIIPINRDTEKIWYNQRMIIDNKGINTEPAALEVSKINRVSSNGVIDITLAQDRFDQHNDYIERDADGNVIGMWADYYNSNILVDKQPVENSITVDVTCNSNTVKVGGSYRTISVNFYDEENNTVDFINGRLTLLVDGIKNRDFEIEDVAENKIKIRTDDMNLMGSILTVRYETIDNLVGELQLNVVGL